MLGQLDLQACALDRWAARRINSPSCSPQLTAHSSSCLQYTTVSFSPKANPASPRRSPRKRSKSRTRRSNAIDTNIRGVIPVPRSSTQAALLTSSARGENRVHEFLHLLLLSRPLGFSFGDGRRSISCPLAHSAALAQDILGILSLSVLRSLPSLNRACTGVLFMLGLVLRLVI